MKQIDIICNDKIYTEMLSLELAERGYRVSDKNTGNADILLIEAEYKGTDNTVTFSRKEGADLVRPFAVEELVSLIEAKYTEEQKADGLYVSPTAAYAVYRGTEISLSELEHAILYYLYSRAGSYVSADELAKEFFGNENEKNTLRVYISYLRNKLDEAFRVKLIYTARGKGYMIKL